MDDTKKAISGILIVIGIILLATIDLKCHKAALEDVAGHKVSWTTVITVWLKD